MCLCTQVYLGEVLKLKSYYPKDFLCSHRDAVSLRMLEAVLHKVEAFALSVKTQCHRRVFHLEAIPSVCVEEGGQR